eukprot:5669524-Amphidinium_carterae.1
MVANHQCNTKGCSCLGSTSIQHRGVVECLSLCNSVELSPPVIDLCSSTTSGRLRGTLLESHLCPVN